MAAPRIHLVFALGFLAAASTPTEAGAQSRFRAWHNHGQTFMTWAHASGVRPDTYVIHASRQPIRVLTAATRIGRVFFDNGANHRLRSVSATARWKLPGPGTATTTVQDDEAYFVSTPHVAGARYFAVAAFGSSTPAVTIGPITERLDPVRAHLQARVARGSIYAHWIDGRSDPSSGRATYAVMGNETMNGIGFNFGVWNPPAGRVSFPTQLPMTVSLHGGFGSFLNNSPLNATGDARFGFPKQGIMLTPDDWMRTAGPNRWFRLFTQTWWFGSYTGFDRFRPADAGAGAEVVDYTRRRVLWETEYVTRNFGVDPDRVAITGISMGGVGTALLAHTAPDVFSVGAPYVPPISSASDYPGWKRHFGTAAMGLKVVGYGDIRTVDLFDPVWRMTNRARLPRGAAFPHLRWVFGRNDASVAWSSVAPRLPQINATRSGDAIYWDEREHGVWSAGHFAAATRIRAPALTAYRKSRSFPGLFDVDIAPNLNGLQPDPGDGSVSSGTAFGTWGGWVHWDPALVYETATSWECGLEVLSERADPSEITALTEIVASVTPLRRRRFRPAANALLRFEYRRRSDGQVLQSGTIRVGSAGEIVVPSLRIKRSLAVLRIWSAGVARAPIDQRATQPSGAGSLRLTLRGLRPNAAFAHVLSTSAATDGVGTGWLWGMDVSLAELSFLAPPFVGVADAQGRFVLDFPANTLPPLTLEVLATELAFPDILGRSSGFRLYSLR